MKLRYGVAGAVLILALAVGGIAIAIGGDERVPRKDLGYRWEF